MKQAEKLLDDLGWSKAVLEIQYEHEVCAALMLVSYQLISVMKLLIIHNSSSSSSAEICRARV